LGRTLEVVDALRPLALLEGDRDGHLPVGLDPRRPEHVVQLNAREGDRLERVVGTRLAGDGGQPHGGGDEGAEQIVRIYGCIVYHTVAPDLKVGPTPAGARPT